MAKESCFIQINVQWEIQQETLSFSQWTKVRFKSLKKETRLETKEEFKVFFDFLFTYLNFNIDFMCTYLSSEKSK